jgi:WD40 repeat protein
MVLLGAVLLLVTAFAGERFYHWWTAWPAQAELRSHGTFVPTAFWPDGSKLVTRGGLGLEVWDVHGARKLATWPLPEGRTLWAGAVSPDGRTLAAMTWEAGPKPLMIDLIDASTGKHQRTITTSFSGLVGLVYRDSGRTVRAVVRQAGSPEVVDADVATGRPLSKRTLSCPTRVWPSALSPDGDVLAFGVGGGRDVVVWDIAADRERLRLGDRPGAPGVRALAFSHDGRRIAVGCEDGSIELWDLGANAPGRRYRVHASRYGPQQLMFSPDSTRLTSLAVHQVRLDISFDTAAYLAGALIRMSKDHDPGQELLLLDLTSGRCLGRSSEEWCPLFAPDGRTLATAHPDQAVRMRELPAPGH